MKKTIIAMLGAFIAVSAMAAYDDIYCTATNGHVYHFRADLSGGVITSNSFTMLHDYWIGSVGGADHLAIQSDGDVIYAIPSLGTMVRLNEDAAYQTHSGGFGEISAVGVQTNDTVLVGNDLLGPGGYGVVYRRDADTFAAIGLASGFTGDSNATVTALTVQSDDDIVIGTSNGHLWRQAPDLGAGAHGSGFVPILSLAIQSDQTILVGTEDDVNNGVVYRRNGDTLAAINHVAGFGDDVNGLAAQSDDEVVIGTSTGHHWKQAADLGAPSLHGTGLGNIVAADLLDDDSIVLASAEGKLWILDQTLAGVAYTNFAASVPGVSFTDMVVRRSPPAPPVTKQATILGTTIIDAGGLGTFMEIVIDAPNAASLYHPEHVLDLSGGSLWTNVPHTDAIGNTLYITNLGYSAESDVTNEVIYLQTTNSAEFFKIIGEQP